MTTAKKYLAFPAAALGLSLLSGCATVISGTNQTLTFNSEPEGAEVYLDGAMIGTTPVSVSVSKNEKDSFMVKKDGYKAVTQDVTTSFDEVALLNIFWDLSTTDMVSGAAFEYEPNSYFVKLSKD